MSFDIENLNRQLIQLIERPHVGSKRRPGEAVKVLKKLKNIRMNLVYLKTTKIGFTVNYLRGCNWSKEVNRLANDIVTNWSKLLPDLEMLKRVHQKKGLPKQAWEDEPNLPSQKTIFQIVKSCNDIKTITKLVAQAPPKKFMHEEKKKLGKKVETEKGEVDKFKKKTDPKRYQKKVLNKKQENAEISRVEAKRKVEERKVEAGEVEHKKVDLKKVARKPKPVISDESEPELVIDLKENIAPKKSVTIGPIGVTKKSKVVHNTPNQPLKPILKNSQRKQLANNSSGERLASTAKKGQSKNQSLETNGKLPPIGRLPHIKEEILRQKRLRKDAQLQGLRKDIRDDRNESNYSRNGIGGHKLNEKTARKRKQDQTTRVDTPTKRAKTFVAIGVDRLNFDKQDSPRVQNLTVLNTRPIITPSDRVRSIGSQGAEEYQSSAPSTSKGVPFTDQEPELEVYRVRSAKCMGRVIPRREHKPKWLPN